MEYNNQLSTSEKLHYTNMWCRSMGIKSRDLDNHPTIDDCILLVNFRQINWQFLTRKEQGIWSAYWSWCYHNQVPIKKAWLSKLENITHSVIIRQNKELAAKAKIQAMRQRKQNQKEGVNMTANPPSNSVFA
jgi:hypothetical protein